MVGSLGMYVSSSSYDLSLLSVQGGLCARPVRSICKREPPAQAPIFLGYGNPNFHTLASRIAPVSLFLVTKPIQRVIVPVYALLGHLALASWQSNQWLASQATLLRALFQHARAQPLPRAAESGQVEEATSCALRICDDLLSSASGRAALRAAGAIPLCFGVLRQLLAPPHPEDVESDGCEASSQRQSLIKAALEVSKALLLTLPDVPGIGKNSLMCVK
eukprot:6770452-Pyramimonas_sp.AAC.1